MRRQSRLQMSVSVGGAEPEAGLCAMTAID
jgi:hypothetical protein